MSTKLDTFYHESKGCPMYEPCPICYKCTVKATHLYLQCAECPLQFCAHNYKQRSVMIRRENFALKISKKTYDKIKKAVGLSKE